MGVSVTSLRICWHEPMTIPRPNQTLITSIAKALVVSPDPSGSSGLSKPDPRGRKVMGRNSLGLVLPNDLRIKDSFPRSTANRSTEPFPFTYLPPPPIPLHHHDSHPNPDHRNHVSPSRRGSRLDVPGAALLDRHGDPRPPRCCPRARLPSDREAASYETLWPYFSLPL